VHSFRTTLCLEHAPHVIACACLYLAAKFTHNFAFEAELSQFEHDWWENFGDSADMSSIASTSAQCAPSTIH
jgi:hypothetical protein